MQGIEAVEPSPHLPVFEDDLDAAFRDPLAGLVAEESGVGV